MPTTEPCRRSSEVGPVPPAPAERRDLLRPGDVLGHAYEIRGKLGEGGMGQVYEAYDRRLDRRVAVKVGHRGQSVSAEARALAALRGHPCMVTVFALGSQDGMEYAVMERIHGVTLEYRLNGHRAERTSLPIDELVAIGAAMADGLAFVHAAGVAHRDVKPANVMLAPDGRVVITDFGIFKPECDHTTPTLVWGTPEYMAPEAVTGTVAPGEMYLVDVYALGVVLREMLAAERPDAPSELTDLVSRMMATSPGARPQTMQEVAWRLLHLPPPVSQRRVVRAPPVFSAIRLDLVERCGIRPPPMLTDDDFDFEPDEIDGESDQA